MNTEATAPGNKIAAKIQEPLHWCSVNPFLESIIDSIVIFKYTKSSNVLSAYNTLPWASKTHLILTLSEEKILIKKGPSSLYEPYPLDAVLGPQLQVQHLDYGQERHFICVNFKAGALEKLCGVPGYAILNQTVEASDIFGQEINVLKQRLLHAKSHFEIMNFIDGFFLKKLNHMRAENAFDLALAALVHHHGNVNISLLAHQAALSVRQFERKSLQYVGMSPKLFAKLTRFSYAYMIKENNPQLFWTDIAYYSGYYDQMHLIRDFKLFLGCNPTYAFGENALPKVKAVTSLQGHGRLQNTNLFKFPLSSY